MYMTGSYLWFFFTVNKTPYYHLAYTFDTYRWVPLVDSTKYRKYLISGNVAHSRNHYDTQNIKKYNGFVLY